MDARLRKILIIKISEAYEKYARPEPKTKGEGNAFAEMMIRDYERNEEKREGQKRNPYKQGGKTKD